MLSSYHLLGLLSGDFPESFPAKTLYAFHVFTILATWPTHLRIPDFTILITLDDLYGPNCLSSNALINY
jgi:hypothetical protein